MNVRNQPVASVDYQFKNGNQRDSVALHCYPTLCQKYRAIRWIYIVTKRTAITHTMNSRTLSQAGLASNAQKRHGGRGGGFTETIRCRAQYVATSRRPANRDRSGNFVITLPKNGAGMENMKDDYPLEPYEPEEENAERKSMPETKPAYEQLTKGACVSRLRYGLPLTLEQQMWLAEQIWGPIGPRKKRCPKCDGSAISQCTYNNGASVACGHCEGKGYVCSKCNGTQGTRTLPCMCAHYEHLGY